MTMITTPGPRNTRRGVHEPVNAAHTSRTAVSNIDN